MRELNITYDRFEKGIDLRKSASVSDANRLRMVRNAYVTNGWAIRKRAGTTRAFRSAFGQFNPDDPSPLIIPSSGLGSAYEPVNAERAVISIGIGGSSESPGTQDGLYDTQPSWFPGYAIVDHSIPENAGKTIKKIHAIHVYSQTNYVIIEYTDGVIHHFYDSALISGAPDSKSVAKLSERIYAANGDVVSFSKVGDPADWSGVDDAGFLATGLQASGSDQCIAVADYDGLLAVFMAESIQLWSTDPLPAQHQLQKIVKNVGSSFRESIQTFSNDVIFLSNVGFRSISRQAFTDNRQDNDVGSPIDEIVIEKLESIDYDSDQVFSVYYSKLGQYWCFIGDTAYVYTLSPSAKVSAWSIYEFDFTVTAVTTFYDFLFLRDDENNIFLFDDRVSADSFQNFTTEVLFSFQSQKAPGINKRFNSVDVVQQGVSDVSHLYDPRNEFLETSAIEIEGNTRPGNRYPMGLIAPEIATRLVNNDDQPWQLDGLMYFYQKIGVRV